MRISSRTSYGRDQHSIKEYQDKAQNGNNYSVIEMTYDANGNLIKDLDRDIYTIKYNILNLPEIVQFKDGHQIINAYDASGKKLSSRYYTILMRSQVPVVNTLQPGQVLSLQYEMDYIGETGTFYIGNVEYGFNGCDPGWYWIDKIYNAEGYVENPANPQYHYFRKDHLGNNREVWLANSNTTKQRTQYYPSGLPWPSNSDDDPGLQNKKYNGKEFVEMHGLDEYDSEARWYYPAIMRTTTIDPLAEKYYSISPYAWCGGNPVKFIDPSGMRTEIAGGFMLDDFDEMLEFLNSLKQKSEENNSAQKQKQETVDNLNAFENGNTGLYNQIQKLAASIFGIFAQEITTTLPNGEKITSYSPRNFTPDYMSVDLSGNAYIPLLPALGGGFDLSLGYVRNDGLFLLGGTRAGIGYDFSISGGLSLGRYTGKAPLSATSLSGKGLHLSAGVGPVSYSLLRDVSNNYGVTSFGSNWNINSIAVGIGLTPVNVSVTQSNSFNPYYLYKK